MRSILFALAVAVPAGAGCWGPALPAQTDTVQGRDALTRALDAWKRGETVNALKDASPPIQVRDPDWSAGHKLTDYLIAAEDGRAGVDLLLSVKLVLARTDGSTLEKRVKFIVAIGSSTVVARNE